MRLKRLLKRINPIPHWTKFPDILSIDTTNICNLKCAYCNFQDGWNLQRGYITYEMFEDIMRQSARKIGQVRPFLHGDPMCDADRMPTFFSLIKDITNAEIVVYTNGSIYQKRFFLSDEHIDRIHFTISAGTPETYLKVHGRPLFKEVVKTIEWVNENKYTHQRIIVQFVVRNLNAHEVPIWKDLFKGFELVVSPLHLGYQQDKSYTALKGTDWKDTIKQSTFLGKMSKKLPCYIWNTMCITWDGTIILCCDAPLGFNYGKVGEISLATAWRRRIMEAMENDACRNCRMKHPDWVSRLGVMKVKAKVR